MKQPPKRRFPGLRLRTYAKYRLLIEPLRATARRCGYAIGVHGSLARDIDLIAVPWTRDALSAETLVRRLIATVKRLNDRIAITDRQNLTEANWGKGHIVGPEHGIPKPHRRRVWCIHLGGGPYLDVSVFPRRDF